MEIKVSEVHADELRRLMDEVESARNAWAVYGGLPMNLWEKSEDEALKQRFINGLQEVYFCLKFCGEGL